MMQMIDQQKKAKLTIPVMGTLLFFATNCVDQTNANGPNTGVTTTEETTTGPDDGTNPSTSKFVVSVIPADNVTITPSENQEVTENSNFIFTVTADTGYTTSSTVNGTCPTGSWSDNIYTTGAITADCSISFSASIKTYTLSSSGTNVTFTPNASQTISHGSVQTYIVTPNLGHTRSNTVGGSCPAGTWSDNSYTTGAIIEDCSITFSAAINGFAISASGVNVSYTPSNNISVAYGTLQSYTVTANTEHSLSDSVGGTCPIGSWNGSTYTTGAITANCSVSFSAILNSYVVTPSANDVTIAPSSNQIIDSGNSFTITVTPHAEYSIPNAVGGTCPFGSWSGNDYTSGAITGDCTVSVNGVLSLDMVYDIKGGAGSSNPTNLSVMNNVLYFRADDGTNGVELWKYDGTNTPSMVADINAGSGDSSPLYLTVMNNVLYFQADDGSHGIELWKYDGTNAPSMVADINNVGMDSSNPSGLIVMNGVLYFHASDNTAGDELWKFDGTNTPSMVADINPGIDGSSIDQFIVMNDVLYFRCYTPATGSELCKYDGTNAPSIAADIVSGGGSSYLAWPVVMNGSLYFQANDGVTGEELWKFDGTTASLVADIKTGAANSSPTYLVVSNNILYFGADDGVNGYELWKYDGTNAPSLAADIVSGVGGSYPGNLTALNNVIYFSANDGTHGSELWKYDGTNATMVNDINSSMGSYPSSLKVMNSVLYFKADDGSNGTELWRYIP